MPSYRLATVLWAFAVVATSMAAFGPWGLLLAGGVFLFWAKAFYGVPFTIVELLVIVAIIGMLVGLLIPAVQAARETARGISCLNQMRSLALGVKAFAEKHEALPAAAEPKEGSPPMSWRVRILPQ